MNIVESSYPRNIYEEVVRPFLRDYQIAAFTEDKEDCVLVQADMPDNLVQQLLDEIKAYERRPQTM